MDTYFYKILSYAFIFIIIAFFSLPVYVCAQPDRDMYYAGVRAAKRGELDFAFINFHALVSAYPDSKLFEDALFSVGEYYYDHKDYADAYSTFSLFIEKYSSRRVKPFAFAYLIKLISIQEKEKKELIPYLQKGIVSFRQYSLVFRDFKEYKYISGLNKKYRADYYIDHVEIYVNGRPFLSFSF